MSHGAAAARDLRYGRRGGRWASQPIAGAPDSRAGNDTTTCPRYHTTYRFNPDRHDGGPTHCGQIRCRALTEWGPDDWAGRARMAQARADAGIELDNLDHQALARTQQAAS